MAKENLKEIEGELYTTYEVAKWLKVTYRTVHSMIRDGRLKAYRIGPSSDWRFKKEDIVKLLSTKGEVRKHYPLMKGENT